jgi:hypothetical protein
MLAGVGWGVFRTCGKFPNPFGYRFVVRPFERRIFLADDLGDGALAVPFATWCPEIRRCGKPDVATPASPAALRYRAVSFPIHWISYRVPTPAVPALRFHIFRVCGFCGTP